MVYTQDPFPFESVLSFELLIDYWRKQAEAADTPQGILADQILRRLEEAPALQQPVTDLSVLEPHQELLRLMLMAVFPLSPPPDAAFGIIVPFKIESAYATPAFDRLIEHACNVGEHFNLTQQEMLITKAMQAYYWVLRQFYRAKQASIPHAPLVFTAPSDDTGLDEYFKVHLDTRFVNLRQRGPLPELTDEALKELLSQPFDLELWKRVLPPDPFIFEGFGVITTLDITEQAGLSMLKDDLLKPDAMATPEHIDRLELRIRTLLKRPDLRLGLISLSRGDFNAIQDAKPMGRSLLLDEGCLPDCAHRNQSQYAQVFEQRQPVVTNLSDCTYCTNFEEYLMARGLRNLLVAPLQLDGELIGLLELGSPNPDDLNRLHAKTLDTVLVLFATAMKRSLEEREDRIQAVIKEQFTALHPVVEWRFRDAAIAHLERGDAPGDRSNDAIVFHDVYPLYALTDIRESSTHRNAAIQADLLEQLGLAYRVVVEASIYRYLPILDELGYRIDQHIQAIEQGLTSGDEVSVLEFLHRDVMPLFEHIAGFGPRVQERIDAYHKAIDPTLGILYHRRRAFEESVTAINDTVAAFLDAREAEAQTVFPHYFEKYKTDGVDYNIFIGASLMADGRFDRLYLRNLRLWQLMTHCGIAWELERLRPSLPVDLQVAQLILVQNVPLSIRFRLDEKRFDVDGTYNIRYEIVKKRIDKARIQGTRERLTQPGYLAIVYTQAKEAVEYRTYLHYLQATGYIEGEIEDLALEELQGASGLRALRVKISPAPPDERLLANPARLLTGNDSLAAPSRAYVVPDEGSEVG